MSFSAAKVRSCSDSARGGSPGRRTVRAQLSWWSWGKFRVLRRGQAKSAGLSPAAAWSGGRGRGRGGREGARGLAGVNGRPRSAPGSAGTSFLCVPPSSALSAPGPRRAVRARSPMSGALQLPAWGARPPHNAAGAPSGTPAPPRGRDLQCSASLDGSFGVPEPRLLGGSLSFDRVREQVLGTRGSSSPGRTRTINMRSRACSRGRGRGPTRVGDVQPEGTRSGTVQSASRTLRPKKKKNDFFFF